MINEPTHLTPTDAALRLDCKKQDLTPCSRDPLLSVELVVPTRLPREARDPDDDHVLACALAARAEFIVSGDKDLLVLERFEGIAIVNAAQALAMIEAAWS